MNDLTRVPAGDERAARRNFIIGCTSATVFMLAIVIVAIVLMSE